MADTQGLRPRTRKRRLEAALVESRCHQEAEARLEAALAEKDILLKEVHHRVKNNLQVMSSLLKLQARYLQSEEAQKAVLDSHSRLQVMALVHEELYRSQSLASVDFGRYIQRLVSQIFYACGSPKQIRMVIGIESVAIRVDQSIPCALIVNELVTNALKYAFQGKPSGEVGVSYRIDNSHNILKVWDTGIGLPETVDFWNPKTLGLQLVNILAEQLAGQLELDTQAGTAVTLIFQ
jgi:two-component sensor histidine kinase